MSNLPRLALWIAASIALTASPGYAQNVDRHLAAGEFAAAKRVAAQMPAPRRDPALAQIAAAQGSLGETTAASGTIRGIANAASREEAIAGASGGQARGGGSFADFQSLIDLIQTTVVPDTWEALGGPSTMAPYPAGVFVDAEGTIRACVTTSRPDALAELRASLVAAGGAGAAVTDGRADRWRAASKMRCVSLRRLLDQLTHRRVSGHAVPDSMTFLAGLSRVQYVFVEEDDIILAGPVGGIRNEQGWYLDRQSGANTLRLDFLLTCLSSALSRQPIGCTIDPTTEGLQRAATVAAGVRNDSIPIGKAADEMKTALGMQSVEVFGTAGDTPIGYLMVEADRHMKELALGIHPMPNGVPNYLDVIDAHIAKGPPDELLLRLWFTSAERSVRADKKRRVFEIGGTPIRLSGQNERAMASGQRGNLTRDFRTEAFVAGFNEHWPAIRGEYPIYGALESIYRVASISELLRRFADSPEQLALVQSLAASSSSMPAIGQTPRQVESIAKLHTVRHGRRVHRVLLASGGVAVDGSATLTSKVSDYPSLDSLGKPAQSRPEVLQRWWWDAAPTR